MRVCEVGFGNEGVGLDVRCLRADDRWIVLADDDDFCLGQLPPNDARGLQAVHARHADVHEDDVGAELSIFFDGGHAAGGLTAN